MGNVSEMEEGNLDNPVIPRWYFSQPRLHEGPLPGKEGSPFQSYRVGAHFQEITHSSNCFSACNQDLPSVHNLASFWVITAHPAEPSKPDM